MNIIIWIISGIIAGWLTGLIVKGSGFSIIGDFIIGLIGGVLGGWLFGFLGVSATGWIGQVLVASWGRCGTGSNHSHKSKGITQVKFQRCTPQGGSKCFVV